MPIKYRALIVKNDTGEARWYSDRYCYGDEIEHLDYPWTEGNHSCDCNRETFWYEAGGEKNPNEQGPGAGFCIGHGRFAVPYLELENGERVFIDGDSDDWWMHGDHDVD